MVDLSSRLDRWAGHRPDALAITFEGQTLRYGELASSVARTAGALRTRLDVRRGDRVAYCGLNRPELVITLFACARLGAIFVPLNWRLTPHEVSIALADAEASVLIGDDDYIAAIDERRAELPSLQHLVSVDHAEAAGADVAAPVGRLDDPLLIVYTSGTTGRPKGAVLTQAALAANAVNASHFQDLTSNDHALTVIPMFHVGGLNIQTVPLLLGGGRVTIHRRFDPGAWLADIESHQPTLSVLVPATMQAVPVAVVVADLSTDVDEATVRTWLTDRLAPFKLPRTIVFVDALPRNAMGKVLKHEVKANLMSTITDQSRR